MNIVISKDNNKIIKWIWEYVYIVTIHIWYLSFFFTRIFKLDDELENLDIRFNIALILFFNEKEDLTSFPDFTKKNQII